MRLTRILIGELVVVIAPVFIFRSLWTILDQYFGYSYVAELLIVGVVFAVIGLVVLDYEIKSEIEKTAKPKNVNL